MIIRQNTFKPANYSLAQIGLHWLIAALILAQYATSGAIFRMNQHHTLGHASGDWDDILHKLHMRLGLLLLLLMGGRLILRLWHRAPRPLGNPAFWTTKAARLAHWAFYGLVIAQGLTGAITSYVWFPMATLHIVLFKLLLVVITIHIAAALWHHFMLKDATLIRILKP
eukprot:gene10675-10748_t